MFCRHCGKEVNDSAIICIHCGCSATPIYHNASPYSKMVALLLCFFLGCLGIHSFYVGKVGTGFLQLITCGGCGIWALIDFIVIATGGFEDAQGRKLIV